MPQTSPGGKLVRDLIPDLIRNAGGQPQTSVLPPDEYRGALRDKLLEEVQELLDARREEIPGEMADVLEVLRALAAVQSLSWERVEQVRAQKLQERGGFTDKIWLFTPANDAPPATALMSRVVV